MYIRPALWTISWGTGKLEPAASLFRLISFILLGCSCITSFPLRLCWHQHRHDRILVVMLRSSFHDCKWTVQLPNTISTLAIGTWAQKSVSSGPSFVCFCKTHCSLPTVALFIFNVISNFLHQLVLCHLLLYWSWNQCTSWCRLKLILSEWCSKFWCGVWELVMLNILTQTRWYSGYVIKLLMNYLDK